jgi:ATP-dependent RNA helicase RhlE
MQFKELNLNTKLQTAIASLGYTEATPIQEKAIQPILDGHDLMGCAQTGTGKTAAFALPILERLSKTSHQEKKQILALILAPTRELAIQIDDNFRQYARHMTLKSTVIYGGVSQHHQVLALQKGVDILIATPGRLLDLMHQKHVNLSKVKIMVLDEADQMLDMGMIHDVKKIMVALPLDRQSLMFSATMPKDIAKLAEQILRNPVHVEVTPVSSTVDLIQQELYHISKNDKILLLASLLKDQAMDSALVFSRTKHGANKIVKLLSGMGIHALAIHGNKSQNARQQALNAFKKRQIRVLVATDVAARGLDISELSHVFVYDLPEVPETYVHRIGRTGRAGLGGKAIAFCDQEEVSLLRQIERLIGRSIEVKDASVFKLKNLMPSQSTGSSSSKKAPQRPQRAKNRRPSNSDLAKPYPKKNQNTR